jgi:CRP-like cAMP-binding protein
MRHFLKGGERLKELKKPNIEQALEFLSGIRLFVGVKAEMLRTALTKGAFVPTEYDAGDVIFSPTEREKRMIIFLDGKAEVYSADEHRDVLLRTIGKGGIIGVANLFSEENFVSRVIAAKKCATIEISAVKYGKLLENDSRAMYNYVAFLSNRVCYLNKKIVCLTAGSAERRLAYFLDNELSEGCDEICMQMNALCEMLNLGRASLYRAADKLCEDGFISREGKTIKVMDRKGMMEKYG